MATTYLDANVFIYATAPGGGVRDCNRILEHAIEHPGVCVTSAETLQEILYVLGRQNTPDRVTEALGIALDAAEILPLTAEDVLLAAALKLPGRFSARDRIHRAVMERQGVELLISGDRDFDEAVGIRRLDPSSFDEWRSVVFGA